MLGHHTSAITSNHPIIKESALHMGVATEQLLSNSRRAEGRNKKEAEKAQEADTNSSNSHRIDHIYSSSSAKLSVEKCLTE